MFYVRTQERRNGVVMIMWADKNGQPATQPPRECFLLGNGTCSETRSTALMKEERAAKEKCEQLAREKQRLYQQIVEYKQVLQDAEKQRHWHESEQQTLKEEETRWRKKREAEMKQLAIAKLEFQSWQEEQQKELQKQQQAILLAYEQERRQPKKTIKAFYLWPPEWQQEYKESANQQKEVARRMQYNFEGRNGRAMNYMNIRLVSRNAAACQKLTALVQTYKLQDTCSVFGGSVYNFDTPSNVTVQPCDCRGILQAKDLEDLTMYPGLDEKWQVQFARFHGGCFFVPGSMCFVPVELNFQSHASISSSSSPSHLYGRCWFPKIGLVSSIEICEEENEQHSPLPSPSPSPSPTPMTTWYAVFANLLQTLLSIRLKETAVSQEPFTVTIGIPSHVDGDGLRAIVLACVQMTVALQEPLESIWECKT